MDKDIIAVAEMRLKDASFEGSTIGLDDAGDLQINGVDTGFTLDADSAARLCRAIYLLHEGQDL